MSAPAPAGGLAPYRKTGPLGRLHGKAYYLSFICIPCWNGRIRREQLWSELIFPGGLTNKNFQKVCTHSQSSGHIRIQSDIITYIRTALSFIFQHSKKPAKYKNDSQTAKSHLISQNFSLNLFCQLANARTAKNIEKLLRQLPRLPQWISIEQTHLLSTSGRLWTRLIFKKRCNKRRSGSLRKQ